MGTFISKKCKVHLIIKSRTFVQDCVCKPIKVWNLINRYTPDMLFLRLCAVDRWAFRHFSLRFSICHAHRKKCNHTDLSLVHLLLMRKCYAWWIKSIHFLCCQVESLCFCANYVCIYVNRERDRKFPPAESRELTGYGAMNIKSCATKTTKVWIHVPRQPVLPPSFISKPPLVVMATGLPAAKEKALSNLTSKCIWNTFIRQKPCWCTCSGSTERTMCLVSARRTPAATWTPRWLWTRSAWLHFRR